MLSRIYNFFNPAPQKEISQDNWVRLRFWIPKTSENEISKKQTETNLINKEKNVGHVSLETKNIYASLWPDSEESTSIGVATQHKLFLMPTPEDDCQAERRPPDYIIDLYTLNVNLIEEKFKEVQETTTKWQLLGRNSLVGGDGQSCSGQTYELLEAGGLANGISIAKNIQPRYLYTTPSYIYHMASLYKQWETINYPDVENFKIPKYADEYKKFSL